MVFSSGECSENVCESVRCLNGGVCAAGSADSGICLCPLGTTGLRCETRKLILKVDRANLF